MTIAAAAAAAQSSVYAESPAGEADRRLINGLLTQLHLELAEALPTARRLRTGVRLSLHLNPDKGEFEIEIVKRVRVRA